MSLFIFWKETKLVFYSEVLLLSNYSGDIKIRLKMRNLIIFHCCQGVREAGLPVPGVQVRGPQEMSRVCHLHLPRGGQRPRLGGDLSSLAIDPVSSIQYTWSHVVIRARGASTGSGSTPTPVPHSATTAALCSTASSTRASSAQVPVL